jgi:hypothetical protein
MPFELRRQVFDRFRALRLVALDVRMRDTDSVL